jgi:hypothetical protein
MSEETVRANILHDTFRSRDKEDLALRKRLEEEKAAAAKPGPTFGYNPLRGGRTPGRVNPSAVPKTLNVYSGNTQPDYSYNPL